MPGQEGHPENAGNYPTECPEAEPDYPGARAGDSGMHSGVMYGDLSHDTAGIGSRHDPGLDVEYFDPNLHYSADHIIEEDDDPGTETIWGDDINCMLPFLDEDPLGMGGDYPLEDRPPYMFFNTGNNDKEQQTKEVETVSKTMNYGEGEEASEAGEETTASEPDDPPPTVIEQTEINNFYDYEYNYDYQYYFFDVGLQFTPRVGSVFSINTNPYMLYVGSAAQGSKDGEIGFTNGTAWKPSKADLPDIIATLGLTYRYAALYDGYWNASTYNLISESNPNVPGIPSVKLESPVDAAEKVFERSWQNRHPGMIINEKEEYEDFFADRGNGSLTETDLVGGEPSWMKTNTLTGYVAETWKEKDKAPDSQGEQDAIASMYTGHNFYEWYREDEVAHSTQNVYNPKVITYTDAALSDRVKRAIEILGEDILLRDEWVASDAYPYKDTMYNYSTGDGTDKHFDMYYYIYSNTSVYDSDLGGPDKLLTQDYVIQSLYRALGVNCVRSQVYLYADKYYTINNTPLATQLTVALDKVNQIQNRMDVFVTRANLDKYWEKALTDGLVQDSGRKIYNEIDGMYKPYSMEVKSGELPNPNKPSTKVKLDKPGTYVETEAGTTKEITYDAARADKLTLAEFCVLVKRAMDIYGEEVLTEREQDMLLVYYGTRLPYTINDTEQFEAIKYLMAKGIVEGQLCWTDTLTIDDMLVILSRVKDKDSRLTFKEIDLKYDESLLDQGYYPANISYDVGDGIEVSNVTVSEDHDYKKAEWFDFFIRLTDDSVNDNADVESTLKVKPSTYFDNGAGGTLSFDNLCILKREAESWTANEDSDSVLLSNLTPDINPDHCRTVGTERFADGFYYLHFQISAQVINNDTNNEYCYEDDGAEFIFLTVNDPDNNGKLKAIRVPKYGGIFRDPTTVLVKNINNKPKEYYTIYYSDGGYNKSFGGYEAVDYKHKEGSTPIYITDKKAIVENRILLSSVTAVSPDGVILKAKKLNNPVTVDTNPSKYLSFDEADFSLEYCDYSRYLIGYARSLQEQPYLAPTDDKTLTNLTTALSNSYDIWFTIVGDKDNRLPDDVYWGDPANGNIVINRSEPTKPVAVNGVNIEFVRQSGNTYYYVLKGQKSVNDVANKLHFKTGAATSNVFTGYVKDNNTILVDVDNLSKLASYGYQFGAEGGTVYTNFAATKLKPNLLVITAEDASNGSNNSLLNIYLYDDLKLCIVNNIAYEVPGNEVLYIEQEDDLGNAKYLINWRAVLGWESGYKVTSVDGNGKIHIGVGFNRGNSSYNNSHVINAWTGYEQSLSTVNYDGKVVLPMTSPYILSNWFIYVSDNKGTFAFVVKNNDKDSADSTINNLAKANTGKPFKDADVLYRAGSEMMQKLLGVKIESGGEEWYTEPYIVSCYNLSSDVSSYTTTRDKLEEGKFFYDVASGEDYTGVWCYVVPHTSNTNLMHGASGDLYTNLQGDILTSYTNILNGWKAGYYQGTNALPIFYLTDSNNRLVGDLVDITCNTYAGMPYGAVPSYAYRPFAITNPDLEYIDRETVRNGHGVGSKYIRVGFNSCNEDTFVRSPSTVCPTGIAYFVVGDLVYTAEEVLDSKDVIHTNIKILQGNCVYGAYKSTDSDKYKVSPMSPLRDVNSIVLEPNAALTFVSMSGKVGYYSIDSVKFGYSAERDELIEEAIRSSLQDLDQPAGVDWQEFTFDRLIHSVDNAFSIILIIALNVIPRVGMFVFIILIGLSVIADIPIWRKFCHNVFDPYKLMTFGHQDVLTINTKLLLVSSMLGLAVFAMFMDGTIIHLLAWLVQFFSGWITL